MDPLQEIKSQINLSIQKKYTELDYSECYVAFLDILGMKNLLDKNYSELRKLFNSIESIIALYDQISIMGKEKILSQNQIRITVMSDSIVLSMKKDIERSFSKIIGVSSAIINQVLISLSEPVFIRGGISAGKLSHTDFSVFGPGLVNSYLLEENQAIYMRCILSPQLYNETEFKNYISTQKAIVQDKKDGLYFIEFLRPENKEVIKEFAKLQVESDKNNDRIKEKYSWLLDRLEII